MNIKIIVLKNKIIKLNIKIIKPNDENIIKFDGKTKLNIKIFIINIIIIKLIDTNIRVDYLIIVLKYEFIKLDNDLKMIEERLSQRMPKLGNEILKKDVNSFLEPQKSMVFD
jgi:hypothetical protein